MTGWTGTYGSGETDIFLFKLDSLGETGWYQTFGGVEDDSAHCVRQTSDGGYILCGSTESFGDGASSDVYVVKTDIHGTMLWDHRSGGIANDGAYSIIETSDGYILTGWTGTADGNHDIYIEKLNASGQTSWYRGYHPGADNQAYSIIQTTDNNFVVAGYTYDISNLLEVYLAKIGPTGNIIWERNLGSSRWEMGHCVKETPGRGLIVAGSRWVSIFPDTTQLYLVCTDENGVRLWDRAYNFGHLDEGTSIVVTNGGDYLMAGYSSLWGFISYDLCLVMIQGDGTVSIDTDNPRLPDRIVLEPAFPNPFNAQTLIRYFLPEARQVRLEVFDILGRSLGALETGAKAGGWHTLVWDSGGRPSGVYFCRLQAGGSVATIRMTSLK